MNPRKTLVLGIVAVLVVAAGVLLSLKRSGHSDLGGSQVFADLEASLGEVQEIRLSKGDGSRVTLRKNEAGNGPGWFVVEREFAADPVRVRELALALARLRVVETKTSEPSNYPRLGVEATDSPASTGTLVEVVAGKKSWSLIVGKSAEGRALYVRKPNEPASLLVSPFIAVDPDQKRWIDRQIVDLPGAAIHDVTAKVGKGPAYLLTRPERGAGPQLSPVPRGRTPVNGMLLDGQAEALAGFNFDDVRTLPDPAPVYADTATFRTFDGQVIEISGRRDGEKALVRVTAHRDAALAARFAPPPAPAATAATAATAAPAPAAPVAGSATQPKANPAEESGAHTVERIESRAKAVEFEVPVYKYEAIFKPYEELLEPK